MPSLFEKAIKEKDHETVRQHLNEPPGLSLNVRNAASQTPMMIACQHDSIDALEEMLQIDGYENSIDAVESTGFTAYVYCAWVKRGRVSGSFKKLQRSADSNGNE